MKTVQNQYQQIYQLNEKLKEKGFDGDCYPIEGYNGMWVTLVKDTSKEKQMQIEQQISMGGFGEGTPREIIYRKGKFAGYTFEKNTSEPEPEPFDPPAPVSTKTDFLSTPTFKYLGTVIVAAILCFLQINVFYRLYLNILLSSISPDAVQWIATLSFSGVTGIVFGLAAMILGGTQLFADMEGIAFIVLEAIAFLIGVAAIDFLIAIIVFLIMGAISVFMALFPTILTIVIVVFLVKAFFKR